MSNLLNAASLVLTPNSYKEGKLYSVIPNTGAGDFTFTRATTATRVNSDGLVELVPYNLFSYSEQFNNVNWTKVNLTVTDNNAVAPDGTMTAELITVVSGSSLSELSQTITTISATNYVFSFFGKKGSGATELNSFRVAGTGVLNNVTINWDTGVITQTGSGATSQSFGNGWWRVVIPFTANSTSTILQLSTYATFATGQNSYRWGAQIVEGTNALPYQKTETRLNIPRLDYSLGGCPNILLEPQRTNLLLQSEDISSASWTKGNTPAITSNIAIAPDGTTSADGIQSLTGGVYRNITQIFTVASNSTVTGSVFVKKETSETFYGGFSIIFQGGTTKILLVIVDAVNGTGTVSGSTLTGTIKVEDYDNYWRISATTTDNGSNTTCRFTYEATLSTNGTTLNPAAGSVRTIWGFQTELGSYATSYIPTTTASVTRNADSITRNNIYTNGLITAAGGTWFVELRNNISRTRDAVGGIWIGDNTTAGTLGNTLVFRSGGLGRLSIGKTIAGSFTSLFTTATDTCKIAIKWNGTTADIFENGVKVIAATAFTPTNLDFLVGNGTDVPKYINQMALFPTPITDEQCSILTSDSYPTAAAAYASLGLVSESPSCLTSTTTF